MRASHEEIMAEMRTSQAKAESNQEEVKARMDSHHEKLMVRKK
jgi:hypothetical protein